MPQIATRIDAQTYLEHITRDGARITQVAEGHLDDPVPTCPGNTVGSLLLHTATVCMFWTNAIVQNRQPEFDLSELPTDAIEAHRRMFERFVAEIGSRDPDQPTWTWFGHGQPMRFWYRRAAQELAVHRWDFENAVGEALPIDPTLAADGIDEMLAAFGPATGDAAYKGGSERFDGNGQTFRLAPTDLPLTVTFAARPDRFEYLDDDTEPDVTARGTASDLLLFLWGRIPASALDVQGDAALLARWQERVKI